MSLELLHNTTGALSTVSAFISVMALVYYVWATKKLSPETVFAVGIAKTIVSRVYRVIAVLALLSTLFLWGSYLAKYLLQDKLLEGVLQLTFLVQFLGMSILVLVTLYRMKDKTQRVK